MALYRLRILACNDIGDTAYCRD